MLGMSWTFLCKIVTHSNMIWCKDFHSTCKCVGFIFSFKAYFTAIQRNFKNIFRVQKKLFTLFSLEFHIFKVWSCFDTFRIQIKCHFHLIIYNFSLKQGIFSKFLTPCISIKTLWNLEPFNIINIHIVYFTKNIDFCSKGNFCGYRTDSKNSSNLRIYPESV